MTEPRDPGEQRPAGAAETGRQLERPPGERYAPAAGTVEHEPSAVRGLGLAILVGIGGATLMVLLAGELAVSSGLLVVAVVVGRFVGLAIRTARGAMSPGRSRAVAVTVAAAAVVGAQVGIWLYARSEGGALELVDYLGQTFGLLVPLEVLLAAVVAVVSAD